MWTPISASGGSRWTAYEIFKKGGLTGSWFLEGDAGKERGDLVVFTKELTKIWNI